MLIVGNHHLFADAKSGVGSTVFYIIRIFYKFIIGFSFRRAFKFWDKSNDDDL